MFRSDAEVALNQVLVLAESSARQLRHTAELLQDPAMAEVLLTLAKQHEQRALQLRHQLQQHGERPDTADEERQSLRELRDTLIAALTRRGINSILAERTKQESQVAEATAQALQHSVPEDLRHLLEQIGEEARAARTRLQRQQTGKG